MSRLVFSVRPSLPLLAFAAFMVCFLTAGPVHGQHGHGGHGQGAQGPGGACPGAGGQGAQHHDEAWASDRDMFHYLLDHRDAITRTITPLENGVATVTETDDSAIRLVLREHVASMHGRVEEGRGIHLRDPLFAEIFRNADRIEMRVEETERGVRVTETSADPHVAQLIRAHAEAVNGFLANGYAEVRRDHAVPGVDNEEL